jgi:hypothetical protein
MKLTPYDTGERFEPKVWEVDQKTTPVDIQRCRFGKVDFDNDVSQTEFTIHIGRTREGQRVINIEDQTGEPFIITHNGQSVTVVDKAIFPLFSPANEY